MKRLTRILFLLCLVALPLNMTAQRPQNGQRPGDRGGRMQSEKLEEFLHAKCTRVIHELNLTSFDSAHFEPVYHELQKAKVDLYRKYGGVRRVRMMIDQGQQVADSTLMRVVTNNARLQVEDALLEQQYLNKFARILNPAQLFQLQQAEQKFRSELLRSAKPAKK